MNISPRSFLEQHSDHPKFRSLVERALAMIARSTNVEQSFSGSDMSSSDVRELWEFRRRIGYYKEGAVFGVDETIDNLRHTDARLRLATIETDQGLVWLWIESPDVLAGLMVGQSDAQVPSP